ncbi:MAG: hypothetical protein ABJF23_33170, partial [Bryobacteraceae bacterium]
MTARIFLKLILGVLCVLVVALTAVDFQASKVAERTYVGTLTRELADKCRMLSFLAPADFSQIDVASFRALARAADGRATAVGHDGRVLADSEADAAHMENHSNRPEIAAALAGKIGSDTRLSNTVGVKFLYVAVPVPSGALRLAVPLK